MSTNTHILACTKKGNQTFIKAHTHIGAYIYKKADKNRIKGL